MGQSRPPGTTVFVGNISYDTTEEKLKDVFSQVGNVMSFRLLYDSNTGRAKGYGFCEYEDKETAMSARRNLNGTIVNGRPLRVDHTDSDKQFAAANGLAIPPSSSSPPHSTSVSTPSNNGMAVADGTSNVPAETNALASNIAVSNSPPGVQGGGQAPSHPVLPPPLGNTSPPTTFMSPADIHQTMMYVKKAVLQHPNEMRELLTANPRLAHAILQGQIMLGMIPPPLMPPPPPPTGTGPIPPLATNHPPPSLPSLPTLPTLPTPSAHTPPGPPPPPNTPAPSTQDSLPHPGRNHAMQNIAHLPLLNGPHPSLMPNISPHADNISPQPHPLTPMPTTQQLPVLPQSDEMVDEQTAILSRVINLTPQEIDELSPEHRQYVLQLKQIVGLNNAQAMQQGAQLSPGQMGPRPPPPSQQRQPYR